MALTPETLPRHELNGLRVRVVDAAHPDLVGIEGRVAEETTKTLRVEGEREARVRQVPKRGTTFEFELPRSDGPGYADDADATHVTVDGDRLVARPARRTETRGDSKWR